MEKIKKQIYISPELEERVLELQLMRRKQNRQYAYYKLVEEGLILLIEKELKKE